MNAPYRTNMEEHLKITAWLQIVSGGLLIVLAIFLGTILSVIGISSGEADAAGLMAAIGGVLGVVLGILSIPSLLGGWGLLRRKPWARTLVIILSVLNLLSFPVGTLIGGYSLWVLLNDDTKRLLDGGASYAGHLPRY